MRACPHFHPFSPLATCPLGTLGTTLQGEGHPVDPTGQRTTPHLMLVRLPWSGPLYQMCKPRNSGLGAEGGPEREVMEPPRVFCLPPATGPVIVSLQMPIPPELRE